jgi:hypothetical protein
LNTLGVQDAPDNVITDAREILDPSTSNEHNRVLLKVMADTGDVGGDLHAVGQSYAGDLSESGIRLFGGCREYPDAHPALLRAVLECGGRLPLLHGLSSTLDQLINGRHEANPFLSGVERLFTRLNKRIMLRYY